MEMKKERREYLLEKIELMSGVSYSDWKIIRNIIDTAFDRKKGELERKIEFPARDEIDKITRSLFG